MSSCIPASEIYENPGPYYYTPTSRCVDAECKDCEEYTNLGGMWECTPCSFTDNCSYMMVECEDEEESMDDGKHHENLHTHALVA